MKQAKRSESIEKQVMTAKPQHKNSQQTITKCNKSEEKQKDFEATLVEAAKKKPVIAMVIGISIVALFIIAVTTTHIWLPILGTIAFLYFLFIHDKVVDYKKRLEQAAELAKQSAKQMIDALYMDVANCVFQPIRRCAIHHLPAVVPQEVKDIIYNYVRRFNIVFMGFKLKKMSPDSVEESNLRFAEKCLQGDITDELVATRPFPYYKDMPILMVDAIEDKGTHFLIFIGYIDNDIIYNYFKNKEKTRRNPFSD